ncbi:Septin-domain-containing protein [Dipodascopsis uninucleata]
MATDQGSIVNVSDKSTGSKENSITDKEEKVLYKKDDTSSSKIIRRKITSFVGFSNLPDQWERKSVRKGFNFNLMIVGESGLGKSTLVSTLFDVPLYANRVEKGPSAEIPKTLEIQTVTADLDENNVNLKLTVVDTPGFGDAVNNEDAWRPIVENIEQRFDAYLESENKAHRSDIVDNRIHACLYFIAPTGHSLKQIDVEVMKKLHNKVNLIPVIAKSDILTDEEIVSFKARIRADLEHHKINIFETPRFEVDGDDTIEEKDAIMSAIPFAVVGAISKVSTPDGRSVRGRKYPWGVVEVDNEDHCDFLKLRVMLVKNYMEELKEYTNDILYESYRASKLTSMGIVQDKSVFKVVDPAAKMEEERELQAARLHKMEAEMKLVFQQKVAQKEQHLKSSEDELFARHNEMKQKLEQQRKELEEKLARLEGGRYTAEEKSKKKGFSLRSS